MSLKMNDNNKLLAQIPLSSDFSSGCINIYTGTQPEDPAEYSDLMQEEKLKIISLWLSNLNEGEDLSDE